MPLIVVTASSSSSSSMFFFLRIKMSIVMILLVVLGVLQYEVGGGSIILHLFRLDKDGFVGVGLNVNPHVTSQRFSGAEPFLAYAADSLLLLFFFPLLGIMIMIIILLLYQTLFQW